MLHFLFISCSPAWRSYGWKTAQLVPFPLKCKCLFFFSALEQILTFYGEFAIIGHSNSFVRVDDAAVTARVALGRVLHVESAYEATVVPGFSGFHGGLPSTDALFGPNGKASIRKVAWPCGFLETRVLFVCSSDFLHVSYGSHRWLIVRTHLSHRDAHTRLHIHTVGSPQLSPLAAGRWGTFVH